MKFELANLFDEIVILIDYFLFFKIKPKNGFKKEENSPIAEEVKDIKVCYCQVLLFKSSLKKKKNDPSISSISFLDLSLINLKILFSKPCKSFTS